MPRSRRPQAGAAEHTVGRGTLPTSPHRMLTFDPPELEGRLRQAVSKLADLASLTMDDVALEQDFETKDFADIKVTPTTELGVDLPRCARETMAAEEAIALVDEVSDKATHFDGIVYHSAFRTLVRIRPEDGRSAVYLEGAGQKGDFSMSIVMAGTAGSAEVGLSNRSVHFGLSVVLRDYFHDKYFPPMSSDDFFVEVRHTSGCDMQCALGLAHAYLFELNSSLGIVVSEWARVTGEYEYPADEEVEQLLERGRRLRPLLVGPGMQSLLREFNRGAAASDAEGAVLSFVKCIEYVSATVVREKQYEDLRKRLLSAEALHPTAAYLDGLLALFEENRQFTKDSEAIKLAIERCCDPILLAKHAPTFLRTLSTIASESKPAERRQALVELSGCLSATRNQLAHAKANYDLTGKECPSDQLLALANCARLAAEQCIRWYAALNPDLRRT